jgi:hypothetical protein
MYMYCTKGGQHQEFPSFSSVPPQNVRYSTEDNATVSGSFPFSPLSNTVPFGGIVLDTDFVVTVNRHMTGEHY